MSNTWITYLRLGQASGKPELIPDNIFEPHGSKVKDGLAVTYRWIRAALASW